MDGRGGGEGCKEEEKQTKGQHDYSPRALERCSTAPFPYIFLKWTKETTQTCSLIQNPGIQVVLAKTLMTRGHFVRREY